MKTREFAPLQSLIAALALAAAGLLHADAILTADFAARTITGSTAGNIAWTTSGLTTPGDLTADKTLYDTETTAGFFVPNSNVGNVGNGGTWFTSFDVDVTGDPVNLATVVLRHNVFSNGGNIQTGARDAKYTVTITGSVSGTIGSSNGITAPLIGFDRSTALTGQRF